jgi:serine protease Do
MQLMKTAVAVLAMCSAGAIGLAAAVGGQTIRWSGSDVPAQRAYEGLRSIGGGSRIGASVRDVDADDVKERKLASESGAVLSDVDDDTPASRAGLKAGDVVVEYDGERVRSARQLTRLVQETPSGRKVGVVVSRDGSRMTFTVEPEAGSFPSVYAFTTPPVPPAPPAPPRAPRAPRAPMPPSFDRDFEFAPEPPDLRDLEVFRDGFAYSFGGGRLGVSLQTLSDQLATNLGAEDGVLVTEVNDDSAASKAGLRAGDVITKVDGREIDNTGDVMRALGRATGEIEIEIVRDKKKQTVKATLEDRARRATGRRII